MKRSFNKSKATIISLIVIVIILSISNYAAIRKLDIALRGPKNPTPEKVVSTLENIEKIEAPNDTTAIIVLVIDDFGYRNDTVSDEFLNLDIPLTCAIIPGHSFSKKFAEKAISAGKEVIIHMPMESANYTPGEEGFKLSSKMTSDLIESKLIDAIESIPEAIGMNNHQGSRATADGKIMTVVASVLKQRNKYFIDSRTSSNTVGEKTMISMGVPTARRNIFLDNDNEIRKIEKQIEKLVQFANKNGMGIGIGHARQNTLQVLKNKIPELEAKGYVFEFASRIVK